MSSPMLHPVRPETLAARGEEITGSLPLGDTDRLAAFIGEALASCEEEPPPDWQEWPLRVELRFGRRRVDGHGAVPVVTGSARATLPVACERCLGLLELEIEVGIAYLLPEAERAEDLLPGFEIWATEGRGVRLLDLVEEEMLLSLPLALVHADTTKCGLPAKPRAPRAEENGEDTQRPFSGLKALIGTREDGED